MESGLGEAAIVIKYDGARGGYIVVPCQGVLLRNDARQPIRHKGGLFGEGRGVRAWRRGRGRQTRGHVDRQTDSTIAMSVSVSAQMEEYSGTLQPRTNTALSREGIPMKRYPETTTQL